MSGDKSDKLKFSLENDLISAGTESEGYLTAAREELRRRLPELRKLPGCPNGSDEDILAMSYPPYYTACPNPFISEWLTSLDRPNDVDRHDPGPFASDVSVGKGNPFYKAHSYPTKVPHPAIMRFILHYTKPGDVVLDGFAGTGMTGVAAQACGNPDPETKAEIESEFGQGNLQWGARRAILGELSPSATYICAGLNLPIDSKKFDRASKVLLERFEKDYGWMYKTSVNLDRGKPFEADIDYVIWSEVFGCPHCGGAIVFYDEAFDSKSKKLRETFACPKCGAETSKGQRVRRKVGIRTLAGDIIERTEMQPVMIYWRTGKHKGSKRPDEKDFAILDRVDGLKAPQFPFLDFPYMHMTHERNNLPAWGIKCVHHVYQSRALFALAVMWAWSAEETDILTRLALRFWIEQAQWGLSWMNQYAAATFSRVNQFRKGVYYVPSLSAECSVRCNLDTSKRNALLKLWASQVARAGLVAITTSSSTSLPIPASSVDYVFVDPPFGENIYYSDLGFLTESWHGVFESAIEEAIENRCRRAPKSIDDYSGLMLKCFEEFYRVLKPGKWMTVEFSNHSNEVWLRIQSALASAGFVVTDTRVLDKQHKSHRQRTAMNAVVSDILISAYKPEEATEKLFGIAAGSTDGAWTFVREQLSRIPVSEGSRGQALVIRERQADRIYERMVGYHVARNTLVPLTAAEFYSGLEQRFPVRDGMYFLQDQVEDYERFRISFKRLAAQELFIRDESSAVQWLRQLLKDRPKAFADIQPAFMKEMQGGVASWEELPDLKEMLEANFVTDEKSRYVVPDPKKTEHLDQLRTRALLKEFAGYIPGRGPLTRFRSEAVRAGFKDAWARKDFGTIVAIGRRLPSDVFIEDSALLHYFRNSERLVQQ